ncbi:hypothetical protein BH09GEM1_BH09GEM1_27120 [soil metagenome]
MSCRSDGVDRRPRDERADSRYRGVLERRRMRARRRAHQSHSGLREEVERRGVRALPAGMSEEGVDLVGEDELFHVHPCFRSAAARVWVSMKRTLRSSSPWITSTGAFPAFTVERGDDEKASAVAAGSSSGLYSGRKVAIPTFQSIPSAARMVEGEAQAMRSARVRGAIRTMQLSFQHRARRGTATGCSPDQGLSEAPWTSTH